MTKDDLHPTMIEWLFAREVCRRWGFSADEIYFSCFPNGVFVKNGIEQNAGGPIICVELRRGDLNFLWPIGVLPLPVDQLQPAYEQAATAWNTDQIHFTFAEFISSAPVREHRHIMALLKENGFRIGTEFVSDRFPNTV